MELNYIELGILGGLAAIGLPTVVGLLKALIRLLR